MLTKTTTHTKLFLSFFILFLAVTETRAQDDSLSSFEHNRRLYFGIHGSVGKDFGKQANFFRGVNETFGLKELLAIPQVQSELQSRTNYQFTLASYPDPMRYNIVIGPGVDILYDLGDVNLLLSATSCKLTTTGIFTLSAINPSNPSGEKIIKTETIEGVERRTWMKAGAQFKNAINERSDFYVELAPTLFFQKAVKNTVNIEGMNYSILVQNPANITLRTSYMGYGLGAGLGLLTKFKANKLLMFGINVSASKLKMVNAKGLSLMADINLSVFL